MSIDAADYTWSSISLIHFKKRDSDMIFGLLSLALDIDLHIDSWKSIGYEQDVYARIKSKVYHITKDKDMLFWWKSESVSKHYPLVSQLTSKVTSVV